MILTKEEEVMAEGRYGPGLEKCINLLIKFGEVFNAEKLVDVLVLMFTVILILIFSRS